MTRSLRSRLRWARIAGLALVMSACSSSTAETTTTTGATTTTTTSTTTTTTTIPLIANGPAIALEGDTNETVEALQFLINCNGYAELTVDGAFGPATLAAVQDTQTSLGREATGAPDDETLAILARGCTADRRVDIGENDDGRQIVVGNVAPDDPDNYFVRIEEGRRLSIVVESDTGMASASVRRADGSTVGDVRVRAWADDITETTDYIVEVSTVGPAVTYLATITDAEVEIEAPDPADDDSIVLDEVSETVIGVCLDTTGESSYVAETVGGHLVVTTGTPGSYAVGLGGVGASVEFVYKDGSTGYIGFPDDFDIEVGDAIDGAGVVFVRGGNGSEPVGLAFSFDRSAAPCEGGSGISIVLTAEGLGIVDFGAGDDETLGFVRSALPGASPTVDTGWVSIDPQANEYGSCRAGTTEVRVMQVDNLALYFTDGPTSFAAAGTRHFAAYTVTTGVFPFLTGHAVGPGGTIADVLTAHPDAVAAAGLGDGIDVFISSPPGDDRWLRATASGAVGAADTQATITSVTGGRFCDE